MIYQPWWIKTEVDIHDFPSYKPFKIRTSIIRGARSRKKINSPSSRDSAQELRGHLSGFLTDVSPSRPIPVSSVGAPQAREKKGAMGIGMGQIWDVGIEAMVHDVNVGSTARSHPQVSTFWGPL